MCTCVSLAAPWPWDSDRRQRFCSSKSCKFGFLNFHMWASGMSRVFPKIAYLGLKRAGAKIGKTQINHEGSVPWLIRASQAWTEIHGKNLQVSPGSSVYSGHHGGYAIWNRESFNECHAPHSVSHMSSLSLAVMGTYQRSCCWTFAASSRECRFVVCCPSLFITEMFATYMKEVNRKLEVCLCWWHYLNTCPAVS